MVIGRSSPRIYGSRVVGVGPGRFYRPYYTFRPRVSLGFGLWVGFPINYPYDYGYYDPYYSPGYPDPYPYPAYPYPSSGYPGYGTSTSPRYPSGPAPYPPAYPSSSGRDSQYPEYPPTSGSVRVQPNQANTGGVSFEITPGTAEVFIDGSYVGTAGEFTPTTQPLGLTPGRHQVEIRAPGYRTMQFDADVVAGQVIPFQGAMER